MQGIQYLPHSETDRYAAKLFFTDGEKETDVVSPRISCFVSQNFRDVESISCAGTAPQYTLLSSYVPLHVRTGCRFVGQCQ